MKLDRNILLNRFKDYVSFNTNSDEHTGTHPSTERQLVLAKHLKEEMERIGLEDVTMSKEGYLMATLPANGVEGSTVGFISHMDTSSEAPGGPVKPRIVENYDGGDICLDKEKEIYLSPKDFPELLKYKGEDLVVTDGTTLLGADDKAGITAIMTAMEYLIQHPEIKHGKIRIGITPDEEIGEGTMFFDVKKFGADFGYTVDGGAIGGLEYENFNAVNPEVTFHGRSVHTGDAKGKMINAISLASEWQNMLPEGEKPECTEGREGFFHVYNISGGVETCTISMLIRDHDKAHFEKRKQYLNQMADFMNAKYGNGTVTMDMKFGYSNMLDVLKEGHMDVVDLARDAIKAAGVTPVEIPIRGGTDGAMLSFKGLPCPNLFTGGENFHGRFEYLSIRGLEKSCETVIEIATRAYALKK